MGSFNFSSIHEPSIATNHDPTRKSKLIRQLKRSGLMRSRMVGIRKAAKDTVLLFLDSHIEATEGWIDQGVGCSKVPE